MPIYEYECGKCKEVQEISQKITEDALKKCPKCKSSDFKKLISRSSFALKGTGYYTTDYKRAGSAAKKSENKKSE